MNASPRPNPFPGLRPFRSDEHHLFFGREEQTAALLQLLRQKRFLAVVGTSGSGKSSLVRAGLIAELFSGTMTRAGSSWEVMVLRPGGNPLENLARAMVEAQLYDGEDPETLPRLRATLRRSRYGLVEAVKQSDVFAENTNLLVVVDQFEELFRFRQQGMDSEEAATAFVNLLLTASEQAERPIYVTITMRSDYLGDCSEIPGLAEAVNDGEYLIPRLQRDQKRAAIEKPIGVGGARISPLLVQRLLNDVGDDPDQLPVLQHALMRMWEVWSDRGDPDTPLDFRDFEVTGGFSAALSNHADEIFAALPDDRHREVCERIFRTLTEKGADNRGIRRPTRLARLQAIAGADDATIRAVLDAYRGAGVTFLMPGTDVPLEERTIVDLSHESLMRCWQRLRGWVEDEAQSARIFRRLADTAQLWRDGRAGLFRDPDLAIALTWRAQQQPNEEWAEQYGGQFAAAVDFLEASNADVAAAEQAREAARQRELDHARDMAASQQARAEAETRLSHRLRWLLAGAAGIAVIALLASLVAVNSWRLANASRRQAQELAEKEAQTANQERQARADAESATNRASQERAQADEARQLAEARRQEAIAALAQAEESFAKARGAVNDYLTSVSDDERLQVPGMQGLRVQLLQSALQFYQQFLQERGDDPTLQRELAGVYLKVGRIYRELNDASAAVQSFAQARRILIVLAAAAPEDPDLQLGLAVSQQHTGDIPGAISILEKLVDPQVPRYQSELAGAYSSAANDPKATPQKRAEFLSKALAVRERLVQLLPDDVDVRLGLSGILNNLAIALPRDRAFEGLLLMQRAVEHGEIAFRLRPAHITTARYLKTQHFNLARYSLENGDVETALASLRRGVDVLERLIRDNPSLVGYEVDLVSSYTVLIHDLRVAQRWDEAARTVERARVRIEEMTSESPAFEFDVLSFHLEAYSLARERMATDPQFRAAAETEAALAVLTLRKWFVAQFSAAKQGNTEETAQTLRERARPTLLSTLDSLEQRPDMRELLGHLRDLQATQSVLKSTTANNEGQLTALRQLLTVIRALSAPFSTSRLARRARARCQQDLARAMLEAGRLEEARTVLNDALAAREQLVQEWSTDQELRLDLAEAQLAAGDHFTRAGSLTEATRMWDQALATLEAGLQRDPNHLARRAKLASHLLHVSDQYGKLGQWHTALRLYRRSFTLQPSTTSWHWYFLAMLLLECEETAEFTNLAERVIPRLASDKGNDLLQVARVFFLSPELSARHPALVRRVSEQFEWRDRDWKEWGPGMAAVRLGEPQQALARMAKVSEPLQRLPVEALALHQLGRQAEAADTLHRADQLAEQRLRDTLTVDKLSIPDPWWSDWLMFRQLRREAHRTIHGRPLPESPYDHLFAGRILMALGDAERATAELDAAVALRPQDTNVWLTRAHIFSNLQRTDQLQADLERAQSLDGDNPRTWVVTGRLWAERGDAARADEAYRRAAQLAQGELDVFLDSGWWVVGPYPDQLDLSCPPEFDPDPSRPVSGKGTWKHELKWQAVSRSPHTGNIHLPQPIGGQSQATSYALNFVYASQDGTATLHLWPRFDARVWLNGRQVFSGFRPGQNPGIVEIPVTVRAGRNVLLVRNRHDQTVFCECAFLDAPVRRGYRLAHLGLWADAAQAFAAADQRYPLHEYPSRLRIQCLLASGQDAAARRVFDELSRKFDRPESTEISSELPRSCLFPPANREDWRRWSVGMAQQTPETDAEAQLWLANAYYRATDYPAALQLARKLWIADQPHTYPLLIMALQQSGKADDARQLLAKMEEIYGQRIREARDSQVFRLPQAAHLELPFLTMRREAHRLVLGSPPELTADEQALQKRIVAWREELDHSADDYVRLVSAAPHEPRLWIDLARRYTDLDRWDEAQQALAQAEQRQPQVPTQALQVARIYAAHQRWEEAATQIAQALQWQSSPTTTWFLPPHAVYAFAVETPEVFERVSQLRPQDRQLWIQRVHYLGQSARWEEATVAMRRVAELDPTDHLTWHFFGTLAAQTGDLATFRQVSREMFTRFGTTSERQLMQRVATTCLLLPDGIDTATVRGFTAHLQRIATPSEWEKPTLALGYYRLGDWSKALDTLDTSTETYAFSDVACVTLRALIEQRLGNTEAAQKSLRLAREFHDRLSFPGPDRAQTNWYNWSHSHVLLKEAEALVPAATTPATLTTLAPADEAARRARRAQADQLTTRAAIAQLHLHVGQKAEAESQLRAILEEQTALLKAEPENQAWQADVAKTQAQLSSLLFATGRPDEGNMALRQAVEVLQQLDPLAPPAQRLRTSLATELLASAKELVTAKQRPEAIAFLRQARQLLSAEGARRQAATLPGVQADVEYQFGSLQAGLGLFPEAAATMNVSAWPTSVELWQQVRAAQLHYLQGNPQALRKVAAHLRENYLDFNAPWTWAAVAIAEATIPSDGTPPEHLMDYARGALRDAKEDDGRWLIYAWCAYRTGNYDETLKIVDTPTFRERWLARPLFALAHHRKGNAAQAQQGLVRAQQALERFQRERILSAEFSQDTDWVPLLEALLLTREAHQVIAGRPLPADPLEPLARIRAWLALGESSRAEEELARQPEDKLLDPLQLLAVSHIRAQLGQHDRAAALAQRSRQLATANLAQNPADERSMQLLLTLFPVPEGADWETLIPGNVTSEGGATLTRQSDDSILVEGNDPDSDVYQFSCEFSGPLKALRLEVIPDPRYRHCGRNGNFILSDVGLSVNGSPIRWLRATADFSQHLPNDAHNTHLVANAIDNDPSSGWAVFPEAHKPHWAIFTPEGIVGDSSRNQLQIRLAFQNKHFPRHSVGRFRLSAARASDHDRLSELNAILSSPSARLAIALAIHGELPRALEFLNQRVSVSGLATADDWLVLAYLQGQRNERPSARQALAQLTPLFRSSPPDPRMRSALRQVVRAIGSQWPEVIDLAEALSPLPADRQQAFEQHADRATAHRERGNWYAEQGRWRDAITDFTAAWELAPQSMDANQLAALFAYSGTEDQYRQHCGTTLSKWEANPDPGDTERILKACLVRPLPDASSPLLAQLAEFTLAGDPKRPFYEWSLFARALYDYRTGDYAAALERVQASREQARRTPDNPAVLQTLNHVVEALAWHGQGQPENSRQSFDRATMLLTDSVPGWDDRGWWNDWQIAHVLYREAQALLAKPPATKPPGPTPSK
ncbi:MAG: hypothetical protein U0935_23570 [Pirellulales bacterium]